MATYTSNYAWTKPSGSDNVDIGVLNDNLDSQDRVIHDAFLNMAVPFSELSTYTVGNIVLYGTKTYKCRVPVTTPGSWTGSTNWDEYKLSEGGLVAGDYVNITNGIINVQTDIGTYDNIRYEFTPTNGGYYVTVTIYINNIQRFQQSYHNDDMHTPIIIENLIRFWYGGDGYYWHYQPLIDSNEHPQNTDIRWYYNDMTVHEETFDVPQDDSTTLVTKGDLDDADGDIYAVMGQMGAKNLIPYPYYEDTEEDRGITWTNQSNGWVVATGTASADSAHNLSLRTVENGIYLPNGTYILNGCPSDGSDSTYYLEAVITKNSSAFRLGIDSGSGVEIEITGDDFSNDGAYVMIRGIVKNAYAIQSSLTFKPMLRLATDTDDTYQPYAKTNKQLTDEIATKVDKVTGKGLSTNDYTNTDKAEVAKVANKADKTATASGETLALVPTSEGRALIHTAYGMSTQSGTPTPSAPVDIVSAKVDLRSVGKNLIPYPYNETTKTISGVTFTDNGDGSVTVSTVAGGASAAVQYIMQTRASDKIHLKAGNYKLSGCPSGGSVTSYILQAANMVLSPQISVIDTGSGADIQMPQDAPFGVWINIAKNTVITTPITFKPMLRLADVTDSTYEPYTKHDTTTDLTLRAIEVTSTDDYNLVRDGKYYIADTIDYSEDNGWSVTRRVGEYEVLGTEGWNYVGNAGSKRVYIAQSSLGISAKSGATEQGYSSHFVYNGKTVSSLTWGNYYFSGSNLVISLNNNSDITDITTAESWLSSNKPKFDYILATPTTETITTAQALALLGLKTYDESTTISSQAEPSCTIAVEYAKERLGALALDSYADTKKIEELTPEIVTISTTLGSGAAPNEVKICDYPSGFNLNNTVVLGAVAYGSANDSDFGVTWNGLSKYGAVWYIVLREDGIYGIWDIVEVNNKLIKITLMKTS